MQIADGDAPPPAAILRRYAAGLLRTLREHSLLLVVLGVYQVIGVAVPMVLGRPLALPLKTSEVAETIWIIGFWTLLVAWTVDVLRTAVRAPRRGAVAAVWRRTVGFHFRAERLWGGLLVMALIPPMAVTFALLKALIPIVHPFDWDPTFAVWDRVLHFGHDPWRLLQPVLGYPIVTSFLSMAYAAWFLLLYIITVWQAFSRRDPVVRMQFLLSVVLIWSLLGNLAATLLASAGPVYYGSITGLPDPFAPLLAYLHDANQSWLNLAVAVQQKDWSLYLHNGENGQVSVSISAMPSMHLAIAGVLYLVARRADRRLGYALGAFVVVILLGSVALAWHYAIDGYAGLAGAAAVWWCCGRLLRWQPVHRLLWGVDTGARDAAGLEAATRAPK